MASLSGNNLRIEAAIALAVLAVGGLALWLTSPTSGDFWWYDSSRHAMNGVFIRDSIAGGAVAEPKAFALAYVDRYPAVNIGFYPPLFYLLSGIAMLALGASHAVAQGVVAAHGVALGMFGYLLLRPSIGFAGALGTGLMVLFVPGVALWARQVQLDVPATAWMLAFAYAHVRHLQSERTSWLVLSAFALACAVLTRVQMVFAFAAFAFLLFLWPYRAKPSAWIRIGALLLSFLLSMPAAAFLLFFRTQAGSLVGNMPGRPVLMSLESWTFYIRALPDQLTWPVFALTMLGAGSLWWTRRLAAAREERMVLGLLLVSSWLMFTMVSNKDPRFNLPSVVLLVLLCSLGLGVVRRRLQAAAAVVAATSLFVIVVIGTPVPTVGGFALAAEKALSITPPDRNILVSAHRDGSFIFNVRMQSEDGNVKVRRADKIFVGMKIQRELGIRDRGFDVPEILAKLDELGIAVVLTQPGYLEDQPTIKRLNQLLADESEFELIERIEMTGNTDRLERELTIYRRR